MLSIVRIALQRPYTFIVGAVMILIVGTLAFLRSPVDIFPEIRIPVIAVIWQYSGLPADDMAGRIVTGYQRILTTTVNDIEHIEAQSMPGIGIVKIFFQPGADIRLASTQITSASQAVLKIMPPGITPPLVINYNASTVPILQLALSGKGMTEQQLADFAMNFMRVDLVTVPGAAIPFPYGGRTRQIQVDIDPVALQSKGLAAQDVTNAIAAQSQLNPAGQVKLGELQYNLRLNNAPEDIEALNNIPVKSVNGATIYMRDVAHVRDGSGPQQNVVHVDGTRSVLVTVLKQGAVSIIDIVDGVLKRIPALQEAMADRLKIVPLNDQSLFVKAAVNGVMKEGVLAAVLTSLMILLFLGSWRSTVIIATSIPLAVLAAIAALAAFGQTLNIMTLGGLALAVGILVDDATVTIENINWHLDQGKDVKTAILDGARQIVVPAFVSLLCICIVFVPMFFLPGVSGYLFVPMALAVIFAMIASFLLSRTLVPTLAMYLLKPHADEKAPDATPGFAWMAPAFRFQRGFEARFERLRTAYSSYLGLALRYRRRFIIGFLGVVVASFLLLPALGENFFPAVDSGNIWLHVRAPVGTRIEESSALLDRIQQRIRTVIPPAELRSIVDNIGLPNSGINTVYSATGTIGPQDGEILIGLAEGHRPSEDYVRQLRDVLPREFPTATFSFLPADIVSQILNFGSPAPIDIQVMGRNNADDLAYAQKILREVRKIPGLADVRIQQSAQLPELRFAADRTRIGQLDLTERDVTNSLATALAGSSQTAPAFWLNPQNGVSYTVVAQTPEYLVDSLGKLESLPVGGAAPTATPQVLGSLGTLSRGAGNAVISQYNITNVANVYGMPQGRPLGAVAADVEDVLQKLEKERPKGVTVTLRGQYQTMNIAFTGMALGLLAAVVMIYLVIVINFQSWLDPFVIITALPGALAGIVWMLFVTNTTLSVPALTGAIMCMGVGTANSILVVSFARERLAELGDASRAALEAGVTRFRPVLMTALAMIIGMAPMALGMGEGGEQNAPLGRAVIGGLIVATVATLMLVPVIFSVVHGRRRQTAPARHAGEKAYA